MALPSRRGLDLRVQHDPAHPHQTAIAGTKWTSCQDAGLACFGNVAYTIETKQPTPQARIDSICVANRRALLGMIRGLQAGAQAAWSATR